MPGGVKAKHAVVVDYLRMKKDREGLSQGGVSSSFFEGFFEKVTGFWKNE